MSRTTIGAFCPPRAPRAPWLHPSPVMFFHSWSDVGRIAVVAAMLFVVVVAVLRLAGQQALAQMSGFDVIVTVTLGSIVASAILTPSLTVADALVAVITLLALQRFTRWVQSRWLPAHHAVREAPRVVLWDGQLLEDRLRDAKVSGDEVRAAVRKSGFRSLSEVRAVVLENDGQWSVVAKRDGPSDESAFFGLPIPGRGKGRSNTDTDHVRIAPPHRLP
jgi:uncharacterized membrane protein YcaP (DUF421 family)